MIKEIYQKNNNKYMCYKKGIHHLYIKSETLQLLKHDMCHHENDFQNF